MKWFCSFLVGAAAGAWFGSWGTALGYAYQDEREPAIIDSCPACVDLSGVLRQEQQFYEAMLKSQKEQTEHLDKELAALHGEIFEMVTNCELDESQ